MLDNQVLSVLVGHIEWAYAVPFPGGKKIVFRVDGQLRGFRVLNMPHYDVAIQPLAYHDALKAAGSIEVQSREKGEKPVNLLTEEERRTLGLLLRGK